MRLIIKSGGQEAIPEWREHFNAFAPHLDVVDWDDPSVDPKTIQYALVWHPEDGRLAAMSDLRLIISAGPGVDHIVADRSRPAHVPIARMVNAATTIAMSEYVLAAALFIVRDFKRIVDNQAQKRWESFAVSRDISDTRIGVMGLGDLGAETATLLSLVGFQTAGWARSEQTLEGVQCYAGMSQFSRFLARTDILVCLLPATQATNGILCTETLMQLPQGASLINVGRGSHRVVADILQALDCGHLQYAVLDAHDTEPLEAESPLWTHPGIVVSPHCAARPTRHDRAQYVAKLIARFEQGGDVPNLYDERRGY